MHAPTHSYSFAPRIERLSEWVRRESFRPVPDDWSIFLTDVERSTEAISRGQYKAVNALGAACIVAATNACGSDSIAFAFGGDGAAVVVPPAMADAVGGALIGLGRRARETLGLSLRVGRIPVSEIRARGVDLRVARRGLPGGFEQALFSGGGLSLAESLLKANPERYALQAPDDAEVSAQGLECRWNDIPSRNGRMMTLMVRARGNELASLEPLVAAIAALLPTAQPVRRETLPLSWPPRHLGTELRLKHGGALSRALRHAGLWLLTGLFSGIVKRQADDPGTVAGRYVASIGINTDHLKLDDVFRAVLDVSDAQAAALEALLEALRESGRIDYGVHYSDHALMTCFVRSMDRHVHFVDGGGGGYAMAAQHLKKSPPAGL